MGACRPPRRCVAAYCHAGQRSHQAWALIGSDEACVQEGKEGELCRRRGLVQERQAQEHHQPEVEPILCNCIASAGYREAV